MVENISTSEKYQDFEKRHNRQLNMLQDNDRNIRRQALNELTKALDNEKDKQIIEFFYRERLVKRLILTLEDQVEKNRELSIQIIIKMIEQVGLKEESQILLPAIAQRVNNIPYLEQSEEIRVALIDLLTTCLESDKYQFLTKMGEICNMIAKVAQDPNPEMKQKCAAFTGKLCRELKEKIGPYMKATVQSFVNNLTHQHSKVRKMTMKGLQDILVCRDAALFFDDALAQLKFSMNDRSQDVRQSFYEVLHFWLNNLEIQSLRKYEKYFILFLLNGIADENQEISKRCQQLLEEHGKNMKDALIQLGEESDSNMQIDQIN